jgi:hypothetical protein
MSSVGFFRSQTGNVQRNMKKRETHDTLLEPRNTQDFNTKGETNKMEQDTNNKIQGTNKMEQDKSKTIQETNRIEQYTSNTIQRTKRMKRERHKTHINPRNKRQDETKRESNETNSWRHQCGATLITNKHFLTAGHCANKE